VKRLGYVLKVYPRLSQTFVVHELRAHERAGLPLTIFSLRTPKAEDRGVVEPPLGAEVVYLKGSDAELPAQLAHAARARGIEHLHAHFAKLATHVARLAAAELQLPYSFTAHARDIFEQTVDPAALAERIRDAAQVVTVSRFNVDFLNEHYGRTAALVYNGLPLEEFPFRSPATRSPLILAVGRLIEKKGFTHLIDACGLLAAQGVPFRCDIVGDGEEHAALAAQILQLGLEARVRLLGPRSPGEVKTLMLEAAMLAVPCVVAGNGDRDGLPTVLLEAMALGTPCVGTDVTGIPEALTDDVTGLSALQGDAVSLAAACQRLLADAELRVRLALEARALIERRFSSEANTRRLRALWGAAPLRVLFRVYNRRGLGHWMRGLNIARELLAIEPGTEIRFFTRSEPPFPMPDARIRHLVAPDPDAMDQLPSELAAFAPDVIVDDTMPPARLTHEGARHVFVMRRCSAERQAHVFAHAALTGMHALVVPHTAAEFGYALPASLIARTTFVGPIARRAEAAAMAALRARLGIPSDGFCLVSTPGGGGFDEDSARFVDIARRVHARLAPKLERFRHVLVLGPNSSLTTEPVDGNMVVLASEPEMASLIATADAVLSAGGYNSVSEIRLEQRPAFFLPGHRTHDDQLQRVQDLASRGLAMVVDAADPERAAEQVAEACLAPGVLAAMRASYAHDVFELGNRGAAQVLLACARR
jgi:glycosyltransferase involved in cell wall biosynthesis